MKQQKYQHTGWKYTIDTNTTDSVNFKLKVQCYTHAEMRLCDLKANTSVVSLPQVHWWTPPPQTADAELWNSGVSDKHLFTTLHKWVFSLKWMNQECTQCTIYSMHYAVWNVIMVWNLVFISLSSCSGHIYTKHSLNLLVIVNVSTQLNSIYKVYAE